MRSSVDSNTIAGFHEEARGYLPGLAECLRRLGEAQAETAALGEMHRLVHLIRGASSVVGLGQLAQLSDGLETYVEDLAGGVVEWDEQTMGILEEAVEGIRMNLEEGPAARTRPMEVANTADPEILSGFLIEAEEALEVVAGKLSLIADKAALLEIRRAVHTLKGAGAMVGLSALSSVAHRMEDALDALYEGEVMLDARLASLLQDTTDLLVGLVEAGGTDASIEARIPALFLRYRPDEVIEARVVEPVVSESVEAGQYVRVPLERVDELVRMVSELFVHRSMFEKTLGKFGHEVGELSLSLERLQRLGASFEDEQVLVQSGVSTMGGSVVESEFDALEFDRYTQLHTHSRDLSETAADLGAAEAQLRVLQEDFDGFLSLEKQLSSQIQERLMRFRMVPMSTLEARLQRTARMAAAQCGKLVELEIEGGAVELDKTLLEKMSGPLEHLLRNAVVHGIEEPAERRSCGKPEVGRIELKVVHEGAQVVMRLSDDGGGLKKTRILEHAVETGLIAAAHGADLDEEEIYRLMFLPGFSTAEDVTELAGRGIGLDVVKNTVEDMKGSLNVESAAGQGTSFSLRLPVTLAITKVLMVETQGQMFALPIASVREVARVAAADVERTADGSLIRLGGGMVRLLGLDEVLGLAGNGEEPASVLVALVKNGDDDFALSMERIVEAREVVVKPLSGLIGRAPHLVGAAALGDGRIVPILNAGALADGRGVKRKVARSVAVARKSLDVLIVDDSLSVRRVLASLMSRQGWNHAQAKDGVEALEHLRRVGVAPDLILMDVEMPRMDGFELTAALRGDWAFEHVPIVMLTSRGGDKHRTKAFAVGVTEYLVKPYQEEQLVETILRLVD